LPITSRCGWCSASTRWPRSCARGTPGSTTAWSRRSSSTSRARTSPTSGPASACGRYDLGKLRRESHYVDGKLEGESLYRYPSGKPQALDSYVAGLKQGPSKGWDEQGKLRFEAAYEAGELHGWRRVTARLRHRSEREATHEREREQHDRRLAPRARTQRALSSRRRRARGWGR